MKEIVYIAIVEISRMVTEKSCKKNYWTSSENKEPEPFQAVQLNIYESNTRINDLRWLHLFYYYFYYYYYRLFNIFWLLSLPSFLLLGES